MNSQKSFERFLSERFDEVGPGRQLPDAAHDGLLSRARGTRQRPQWLALIKEPPMRTNSHLAVGSPTVRVAAVIVATLLLAMALAAAGIAGQRLLAADAIIVAQDGSGHHETITDAVAAAEDGDEILVRPGVYVEAVTIDKDIELRGDGAAEDIIIEAPEDGPLASGGSAESWSVTTAPDNPYALLLLGSDAEISGLTLRGLRSALHAQGGAPVLRMLRFDSVGAPFAGRVRADAAVVLIDGTTARFEENTLAGGGVVRVLDRSSVTIEDNVFRGGPYVQGSFGDDAVVRGNSITDTARNCISILDPTSAHFEANTCEVPDDEEAFFFRGSGEGYEPVIRGNVIRGAWIGIGVIRNAAPTIEENEFYDTGIGIMLPASDARVSGNVIRGGDAGIVITTGGSPMLTDNTVEGVANRGIFVGNFTSPTLTGNRVCDNGTNLVVQEGAEPVMDDNDICPDAPSEPGE